MSLFIAGQAFPVASPISPPPRSRVFAASVLSAVIGVTLLWSAGRAADDESAATRSLAAEDAT